MDLLKSTTICLSSSNLKSTTSNWCSLDLTISSFLVTFYNILIFFWTLGGRLVGHFEHFSCFLIVIYINFILMNSSRSVMDFFLCSIKKLFYDSVILFVLRKDWTSTWPSMWFIIQLSFICKGLNFLNFIYYTIKFQVVYCPRSLQKWSFKILEVNNFMKFAYICLTQYLKLTTNKSI